MSTIATLDHAPPAPDRAPSPPVSLVAPPWHTAVLVAFFIRHDRHVAEESPIGDDRARGDGHPWRPLQNVRQTDGMNEITALYRKYSADVYRFALYLSGNHAVAEDIASETFVRVWMSPSPLEMATVKAYLFTIARNLFLHDLRRARRQVALDESLQDTRADSHTVVAGKLELQAVLSRLQRLPEADRAALLMSAVDGIPYEDIARSLGLSVAAVKSKIHRARLALVDKEPEAK
jgi:RNA polymerase sigma-70 factor (ECF subfamily)